MENVNFYTYDSFYFPLSRPILLKLHILAHLIESFRTVYGLCGCVEIKMSIPLGPMLTDRRWNMSIFALSTAFISSLISHPAEIAYFSSPNRELSNGVRFVRSYSSVLRPILLKLHILLA